MRLLSDPTLSICGFSTYCNIQFWLYNHAKHEIHVSKTTPDVRLSNISESLNKWISKSRQGSGWVQINEYQQRRRIATVVGIVSCYCSIYTTTLVLQLCSRTPLLAPLIYADSNPINQVDQSSKVVGLAIKPILTESP